MCCSYFKDADGFIFVFDVSNPKQTSVLLEQWFERVRAFEQRHELPKPLPKVKFANKRDLIRGVVQHNDTSQVRAGSGWLAGVCTWVLCCCCGWVGKQ
jgi:GTPase SAR1 family protein